MSRLKELINKLCPDGVEYVELGEVCSVEAGKLNANASVENGKYPFFTTAKEVSRINTYRWDTEALLVAGNANVGDVKYYIGKFEAYQRTYVLTRFRHDLFPKYLYYVISDSLKLYLEHHTQKAAMSYIVLSTLLSFRVPLPPIEIQKEIVRILDKFTEYDIELQSELQDRIKQYEYYIDKLLNFCTDIPKVKLGEAFYIKNGYTPSKSNPAYWEQGTIPWFRMEDIRENGRVLKDSIQHVTPLAVKGELFPANSIVMSTSATIGEHAIIEKDFIVNQRFTVMSLKKEYEKDFNNKFLFYYCYKLSDFCKDNLNQGSFPSVDMAKFLKFTFPLPPLAVQNRIVEVLDNFDKICSDLKIGLPAEIEKRQQQYEFYRNKILTFKERKSDEG